MIGLLGRIFVRLNILGNNYRMINARILIDHLGGVPWETLAFKSRSSSVAYTQVLADYPFVLSVYTLSIGSNIQDTVK